MSSARIKRRLAAVMAMDAVGYTRLMEADEVGTLAALNKARAEVIDPRIEEFGGRLVKTTGDGLLIEFPSAVAAVECAIAVQRGVDALNFGVAAPPQLQFRIGLNIGEIIVEGDDIYGEGVNLAARLQQIAAPRAIYTSEAFYDQVRGRANLEFRDLGLHNLKNISQPVRVYSAASPAGDEKPGPDLKGAEQEVRFCRSADGTMIAYAGVGTGPPVVKAANWLTHLEFDWLSPIWRPLFAEVAREHLFVRYDQRGNGLSDREATDFSLDAHVADLEATVDAAGIDRFALLGLSQGGPICVAYAAKHPERVTRLVLHGTFAQGWRLRGNQDEIKRREAMLAIMEAGWGSSSAAFHQMFSALFVPEGKPDEISSWIELQRTCTAPKQAIALSEAQGRFDVLEILPRVRAPTLVTHSRHEAVQPFEAGRKMASLIPGARFVPLESHNHIILEHEPAWRRFIGEVISFLRETDAAG